MALSHKVSPHALSYVEKAQSRTRLGISLLFVSLFFLELCLGSVFINPSLVLRILFGDTDGPESFRQIVLLFRLPRALTATLAGSALGLAGLQMQNLFRNPLADPSILGVNSGASLGVALVVLSAGSTSFSGSLSRATGTGMLLVLASSLGSFVVMVLVLMVARSVSSNLTLLIVGLMVGYLAGSLVTVLMSFSLEQQLQRYVGWTFGSFASVTWNHLALLAPVIISVSAISVGLGKLMNTLLLGETYARSLGVRIRSARLLLTLLASILAGAVTAYCGPIGFLGIAVPHLSRSLMRTSDHYVLLPAVLLVGATLALAADLVAQLPGTAIALPLNAVTALVGAPVVLSVVLRRRQLFEALT
jgi:iron complex transport system permease protein